MFQRRQAALPFLLVSVFIDMLGLGLVVPVAPRLITVLSGHSGSGARVYGTLVAVYGLTQFVASPLLGALADRYGRRPVLLVSLAALGLDYLAQALTPGVSLLYASRALAGACAGTPTVVNAYVADVVPPARRARAYGLVGSAFGAGFVAGPAVGGLLGSVNLRAPFLLAAALAFGNFGYGLLVLPESLPAQLRHARLRAANPVGAVVDLLRRPGLARPAWARLCGEISRQLNQVVWALYAMTRFGWGTAQVGSAMALGALCGAGVGAYLVEPCVRRLGERGAVVLGSLGFAAALAGAALAPRGWLLYPLMALGTLGVVAGAATQAWLTRGMGPHERGRMLGALTGVSGLTEAVVPVPAAALFAWSVPVHLPGLALLAAAGFMSCAALLAGTARRAGACTVPATISYLGDTSSEQSGTRARE